VNGTAVQPPPEARSVPGDAAAVASRTLVTSELLCESVDLHAGERVLEVACGSGNAALAAARRFCRVVGVDRDPALRSRARRRAEAEGLEATFLEGEPDDLPLPTAPSRWWYRPAVPWTPPSRSAPPASCCGSAGRAVGSAWSAGPRTATSAKGACALPTPRDP
jgi:SAM-dependent methyltransferase